jgi:adenosylcobyric acid synthase
MTATLMLQGTGSDVGKSLVVAGLARAFTRRGLSVRPFKPQNMSNNAAVTPDGGEIGRAQALQAQACGVAPSVHMNPVLLKPQSETGAQIVVRGKVEGTAKAADYHALKPTLMPRVLDSFDHLKAEADLVLVEGAGSPAEVNIRDGDIANMGFALEAAVPVILVADIDRGGVLASLTGTHMLIEAQERALLRGYLVNKFRGDKALFTPAVDIVAKRTGMICHGVIPWFAGAAALPAEDAVALDQRPARVDGAIVIAVPRLSRIANFDDLDPLAAEPDVTIDFVEPGRPIPAEADLILLPGSKSTIADLAVLREQGWDIDLQARLRQGKPVIGLCAGYQMLGSRLDDPEGTEGPPGAVDGLGLLAIDTVLTGDKRLVEATGRELTTNQAVRGYEMHIGKTSGAGLARPMVEIDGRPDGAVSPDGLVMGCYLHGLFASDDFRRAFLSRLREGRPQAQAYEVKVESTLDDLAAHLEAHCDLDALLAIAERGV